jgi:hypothetical protein
MTLVVGTVVKAAALGFIAGAIGVLVFHQGLILVLHVFGAMPFTPYSLKPTAPFGMPQVMSLAFFGGLWGIALILIMVRVPGADRLWLALLFGGILPPLAAAFIVTPLKGGNIADWFEWRHILFGFLINGVWGLGTALAYRGLRRVAH